MFLLQVKRSSFLSQLRVLLQELEPEWQSRALEQRESLLEQRQASVRRPEQAPVLLRPAELSVSQREWEQERESESVSANPARVPTFRVSVFEEQWRARAASQALVFLRSVVRQEHSMLLQASSGRVRRKRSARDCRFSPTRILCWISHVR